MARDLLPPGVEHPHLVLCGVKSESQLQSVLHHLQRIGVSCRPFLDADFHGQLTAIATESIRADQRAHFRRYQCLRLRKP